jgi:hypothetical protein
MDSMVLARIQTCAQEQLEPSQSGVNRKAVADVPTGDGFQFEHRLLHSNPEIIECYPFAGLELGMPEIKRFMDIIGDY